MFKDYYSILDIKPTATQAEVKQAYRHQTKIWHPDRNRDKDTTKEMQEVLEAYSILSNLGAKVLYDKEYFRFKHFHTKQYQTKTESTSDNIYKEFYCEDELLLSWIEKARESATRTVREFKGATVAGIKEAGSSVVSGLVSMILFGLLVSIVGSLFGGC